jgi:hypothetical protein
MLCVGTEKMAVVSTSALKDNKSKFQKRLGCNGVSRAILNFYYLCIRLTDKISTQAS